MKRFIPLMVGMLTIISIIQFRVVVAVDDEKTDSEINDSIPELYIKAINPGYTIDGKSNTGEMIEIARKKPGSLISLAGVTVRYTNSSGNTSTLLEFPENSYLAGEAVLLRLASSPESELANLNYSKTLAMKGGIELAQGEEVMDKVCWTGKGECYKEFVSAHPTTLIRNLITGEFEQSVEYEPVFIADSYEVEMQKEEDGYGKPESRCKTVKFSELLSYYETNKSEQFIELHNEGSEQTLLDGCQIRYKNKNYNLQGIIKPDEYYAYYPMDFSLTKNPVNENDIQLID